MRFKLPTTFYFLPTRKTREGFTLVELLVFLAIFSLVTIGFITIFISILRVYSRQSASGEVNRQTSLALQTIQSKVERSSLIDMTADSATTTIKLRMPETSLDPTLIYLENGTLYIKEGSGTPESLTNNKVTVSNANFIKRSNSPGRDMVEINFTMEYLTDNLQQKFVRSLDTAIARVSAATFDSSIVASTTDLHLGVNVANWKSVNSTIWFSGSNVGIGVQTPVHKLQVTDGDIYVDTVGKGIILRSPAGGCWRVTVSNAGAFTSASTTCP